MAIIENITTTQGHNGIVQVSLDTETKSLILKTETGRDANDGLRLDADAVLILINTFFRCLPELMLTNHQCNARVKKGLGINKNELDMWQTSRTKRLNKQKSRNWSVALLLSIVQTLDDDNMIKILNLCSASLSITDTHYPVLIQHLRNARVQIRQSFDDREDTVYPQ